VAGGAESSVGGGDGEKPGLIRYDVLRIAVDGPANR